MPGVRCVLGVGAAKVRVGFEAGEEGEQHWWVCATLGLTSCSDAF